MKNFLLALLLVQLLFSGCNKTDHLQDEIADEVPETLQRKCGTMVALEQAMKEDPSLEARMALDEIKLQQNINDDVQPRLVNGVIEIPVVVNVIYKTTAENITDAQVQSQIDVLNEDFNAQNADYNLVPSNFTNVKTSVGIRFVLDNINRKQTTVTSWSTNNAVKKTAAGGLDPTSPTTKLNIWVCNLGSGLLGYAQFPGGAAATDGVVILYTAFGRVGNVVAPYNKGRTATHEVGHWLNLRHIWGDFICGNDMVGDTPMHNAPNYGCPATGHRSNCWFRPYEMYMNYMDYTNDACMYMFTKGQKNRIMATFATGGKRNSFAQP